MIVSDVCLHFNYWLGGATLEMNACIRENIKSILNSVKCAETGSFPAQFPSNVRWVLKFFVIKWKLTWA